MNACMDVVQSFVRLPAMDPSNLVRVVEGQSYLAVRIQNPSNAWFCTILQRLVIHRAVVVIKLFPKPPQNITSGPDCCSQDSSIGIDDAVACGE